MIVLAPRRTGGVERRLAASTRERAFTIVGLMVLAQAGLSFLPGAPADYRAGGNGPLGPVVTLAVCAGAALFLLRRPDDIVTALRGADPALLAVTVLAIVSVLWAVDPGLAAQRTVLFAGATVFGLYLGGRYSLPEQLRLLAIALAIASVLSLLVIFALPSRGIGVETRGSAWQGIFRPKNVLGRAMSLQALVLVLLLPSTVGTARRWVLGGLALSLVLLLGSSARFALGLFPLLAALAALTWALIHRNELTLALFVYVVVGAAIGTAVLATSPAEVLSAAGRDATLTGRTELWSTVVDHIGKRPLLGYGLGAFWNGWREPSTEALLRNPWDPPHAHNGLLEAALELGWIGAGLWLTTIAITFRRALRTVTATASRPEALWPFVLILFVIAYNVIEATIFTNSFFWALFVAVNITTAPRPEPAAPPIAASVS